MDIAVLVNLRARRGSDRVAAACLAAMPGARVLATSSLDETASFTDALRSSPPDLLVSAGGDGTAVGLLTALRAPRDPSAAPVGSLDAKAGRHAVTGAHPNPALALLPLGTGNGWAHTTGAPRWRAAVDRLGRLAGRDAPLPVRHFDLIDVCGMVAPFAGTGWDAEVLDDYHAIKTNERLPQALRLGLPGYLLGLGTRTIPRHAFNWEPVEVEVENLGEDALAVDDFGRVVPVPGGGNGAILYRGPMSVAGSGTSEDLGFGFRALPFAGAVPGRFSTRVYAARPIEAVARIPALWRGQHPLPHNHTWLLTDCRMRFSRPVPFQVGGDRMGFKTEVDYHLARQGVDVLDWRIARQRCAA